MIKKREFGCVAIQTLTAAIYYTVPPQVPQKERGASCSKTWCIFWQCALRNDDWIEQGSMGKTKNAAERSYTTGIEVVTPCFPVPTYPMASATGFAETPSSMMKTWQAWRFSDWCLVINPKYLPWKKKTHMFTYATDNARNTNNKQSSLCMADGCEVMSDPDNNSFLV